MIDINYSKKQRIILVGASGLIGTALMAALLKTKIKIIPLFLSRKVSGGRLFNAIVDDIKLIVPDLGPEDSVVMLSANTDQEWVSSNPHASRKLNVEAVARILKSISGTNAQFVFMSSEAVFGKDNLNGWEETDNTCPSTEYGRQKEEAEQIVRNTKNFCILRTGWNVGYNYGDRCIIKKTYDLLFTGAAKMAKDNIITLTNVNNTANALIELCSDQAKGIFHIISPEPIIRSKLAEIIISNSCFGGEMTFEAVNYKDINVSRYRSKQAYLKYTSISSKYCCNFEHFNSIISRKVEVLDSNFNNAFRLKK